MKASEYVQQRSENLAGIVSLGGSSILVFSGDVKSAVAAGIFTVAEGTLAKFGHNSAGYSAGAAGFCAGDLTLAFSDAVQSGSTLQMTLVGMAGAWGIGAARYPTEKIAEALNSEKLQKVADNLAAICGSGNLVLRVPGIASAASSGNGLVTVAMSAWAVSDVLAGRLQEKVKPVYAMLQERFGKGDAEINQDISLSIETEEDMVLHDGQVEPDDLSDTECTPDP